MVGTTGCAKEEMERAVCLEHTCEGRKGKCLNTNVTREKRTREAVVYKNPRSSVVLYIKRPHTHTKYMWL